MQKSNAPTKLTVAFASGTGAGPVNDVPLTPGATPGTASYQTGFTTVNMEPIASGGIPPFGADFNGVFKAATTAQIWQQSGYMYSFDSGFASNANIGGYPAGSVLLMSAGLGLWINQTDNNADDPDSEGSSGWVGFPAVGAYTIATTGGTTTPDPSVLGVTTLLITGALTANAVLVLPLVAGSRWIVANNTTGAFTLTVQGATGAGVSITQGSALTVFTDGVDYFAASANISGQYLPINGTAVAATKLATPRAFSITGLATAAAINFDGTGNVVFNVTALNVAGALGYTPANDASVVHIAGTETITGIKTFQQSVALTTGVSNSSSVTDTASDPADGVTIHQGSSVSSGSGGLVLFGVQGHSYAYIKGYFENGSSNTIGDLVLGTRRAVGNTTLDPVLTLKFDGSSIFAGGVTCTTMNATSSDRRLKRNICKFSPRPLHRSARFVSYTLKSNGWQGLGSLAQDVRRVAPEHVGEFEQDGRKYLSLNYAGMAYEEAVWAGHEIDRLLKRVEKLERSRLPRKPGFLRRLREILW